MARRLQVLILDDVERWRDEVHKALVELLGGEIETARCAGLADAEAAIEAQRFDLAIVDLSLLGLPEDFPGSARSEDFDELGIQFLATLRGSARNRHCAVVVLTGHATPERLHELLKRYEVYEVLPKGPDYSDEALDYSDEALWRASQGALREARAAKAECLVRNAPLLTVRLGSQVVKDVRLESGSKRSEYEPELPFPFPWQPLVRHANLIEHSIHSEDPGTWRQHANDLGSLLHKELTANQGIQGILSNAQYDASSGTRVRYRFATPTEALGIPFEMLRHGEKEDPICLDGPVSRQVVYPDQIKSEIIQPFHRFLAELGDQGRALRVLLVAANVDGKIPAVDQEVALLTAQLQADFKLVGIKVDCTILDYGEATYGRVKEYISERSFHLLHYAGHGLHRVDLPETSGLVLREGDGIRVLTAADLKLMVQKTQLRMAFLSSCLGARTALQVGKGDFHGTLEALARGGVPVVLGYRWAVDDGPALHLASAFYRSLSRTFSPEEALFRARLESVQGEQGRNNPTWMSPILLAKS